MPEPKITVEADEVQRVAKALGVNLDSDDDGGEKAGKDSELENKTDTSADEEADRIGEEGKEGDEKEGEEPDYKKMYSDSTKEFQSKYKPMEDKLKKMETLAGKSIDSIIEEHEKADKPKEEDKKEASQKREEVDELSSLKDRLSSLEDKQGKTDEKDQLSAKQIIDTFRLGHEMSEDDYSKKIQPLLDGVQKMRKPSGDPYTLEEGLELAYVVANKDNIDTIVDQKIKVKQKEGELTFAPTRSKDSSDLKKEGVYTEQQQEMAGKLGTSLEDKE